MWGDSLVSWVLERERFKCQIAEISSGTDLEKKKSLIKKEKNKMSPKQTEAQK